MENPLTEIRGLFLVVSHFNFLCFPFSDLHLQVVSFIQRLPGCKEQASVFREEVSGVCPEPVLQILEFQRAQACSAVSLQSSGI